MQPRGPNYRSGSTESFPPKWDRQGHHLSTTSRCDRLRNASLVSDSAMLLLRTCRLGSALATVYLDGGRDCQVTPSPSRPPAPPWPSLLSMGESERLLGVSQLKKSFELGAPQDLAIPMMTQVVPAKSLTVLPGSLVSIKSKRKSIFSTETRNSYRVAVLVI